MLFRGLTLLWFILVTILCAQPTLDRARELERLGSGDKPIDESQRVRYLREAATMYRSLGASQELGTALYKLGTFLPQIGEYEEALAALEELADIRRKSLGATADFPTMARIARIYQYFLGDYQKALAIYQQMVHMPGMSASARVDSLRGMREIYIALGDYSKALYMLDQLAALPQPEISKEAALLSAAIAHDGLGEHAKARTIRLRVAGLREEKPEAGRTTFDWLQLGALYSELKQWDQARHAFESALALERAGNGPNLAPALEGLAHAAFAKAELSQAMPPLEEAISLRRRGLPAGALSLTFDLLDLANLRRMSGDLERAQSSAEEALAMARFTRSPQAEAYSLYSIGEGLRLQGHRHEALQYMQEAVQKLETQRVRLANPDQRASFASTRGGIPDAHIDLLMELAKEQPGDGYEALAFTASEANRARSMLDLLAESRVDIRRGIDSKLAARERDLRLRLAAQSDRQINVLSRPHTPEEAERATRRVRALEVEYDNVEASIRTASPAYAAVARPVPVTVAEVQRSLLKGGAELIEYRLAAKRSYAWVVSSQALQAIEIAGGEEIEAAARRYYAILTTRNRHPKNETVDMREARIARADRDMPAAAARLSALIVAPLEPWLRSKQLLVVKDGALHYVPLGALPGQDGRPLIANHQIVTIPSASALAALRQQMAARRPAPKMIAVIADPVFDRQDRRVAGEKGPAVLPAASMLASVDLERSVSAAGMLADGRIPRLPFSRREADAITSLVPASSMLRAVDFDANLDLVTSGTLAAYRILHFASHGLLNSASPELSGIVLSLVDANGKPRRGFLRLDDIYNLRLSADLVVLSACQTALGKEVRGEGLIGLTRGFFYAGAARVAASLWKVDDAATSHLMSDFYTALLHDKLPAAAALRQAQLRMLAGTRWASPYYWAAFELQGEWK